MGYLVLVKGHSLLAIYNLLQSTAHRECGSNCTSKPKNDMNCAGSLTRESGPDNTAPCPYVRLSFVTAPEELLEVAVERLGKVLRAAGKRKHLPRMNMPRVETATNEEEVL